MEKARVAIIEDAESFRELARIALEHHGHSVIAEAKDVPSAFALLEEIKHGLVCDVILLDGNLTKGPTDFKDAHSIFEKYKKLELETPIIGYSSGSLAEEGIVSSKFDSRKSTSDMLKMIASL